VSDLSKEDKLLLEQAFADVKPMNLAQNRQPKAAAPSKTKPRKRYKSNENQQILDTIPSDEIRRISYLPSGQVSWFHPSLRAQEIKKLRNGQFSCSDTLDLHGFTQNEATPRLYQFLNNHYQLGNRCVLIIHGKGYNSIAEPIIKTCVIDTLSSYPEILAFCSALPKHGGAGAVYVLFRKNDTTRPQNSI
jgi:DNA-nicking Smr family endonuclease